MSSRESMDAAQRVALWTAGAALGAYAAYRVASARLRHFDLANRVVVITGGARGLGLVMARALAAQGAKLAICSRQSDQLRRAAAELSGTIPPPLPDGARRGIRCAAHVYARTCDVTSREELAEFFSTVQRELGPVDVLINNAGVIEVGPRESMTTADFEHAMNTHFWAPLHAIELVLPGMLAHRSGRIVNIASIGGQIAVPHLLPYCASKFALVGLSQGLRAELAPHGVFVTTVCPGLMRTGSHWHALFKGQHRREAAWFSLGASSPALAMSAERAAQQILAACQAGRPHVTLSLPAKTAALLNALAPNMTAELATLAARLLPAPGGIGARAVEGRHSRSAWFPSLATLLGERAALRNNEL